MLFTFPTVVKDTEKDGSEEEPAHVRTKQKKI